jgi:hypothetical protein
MPLPIAVAAALAAASPAGPSVVANADGGWTIMRDIEGEPAPETLAWLDEAPEAALEEETESADDLRDAFEEAIDMARHPD